MAKQKTVQIDTYIHGKIYKNFTEDFVNMSGFKPICPNISAAVDKDNCQNQKYTPSKSKLL